MPAIQPIGPLELTHDSIDRLPLIAPGVYLLMAADGSVLRVGRSDTDLRARLKTYLNDESYGVCKTFSFQYAGVHGAMLSAYEMECVAYHKHNPPMNRIHPDLPQDSTHACPIGCGR